MNFKHKYVNNPQIQWEKMWEKYRRGEIDNPNEGEDREIPDYYEDNSDYYDDDPYVGGKLSLEEKVRELLENDFDESDSDEHKRWERQNRANKRKHKKYIKACAAYPSKFHELEKDFIYQIWAFLASPIDILHFLSWDQYLAGFREDQEIWRLSCEIWFRDSRLLTVKQEGDQVEQRLTDSLTYKGMIYQHNNLL